VGWTPPLRTPLPRVPPFGCSTGCRLQGGCFASGPCGGLPPRVLVRAFSRQRCGERWGQGRGRRRKRGQEGRARNTGNGNGEQGRGTRGTNQPANGARKRGRDSINWAACSKVDARCFGHLLNPLHPDDSSGRRIDQACTKFSRMNEGRPYAEQIKPANFLLLAHPNPLDRSAGLPSPPTRRSRLSRRAMEGIPLWGASRP